MYAHVCKFTSRNISRYFSTWEKSLFIPFTRFWEQCTWLHIIASSFYFKNTKYIIIHITPYVLVTFYTSEAYSLLFWLIQIFLIFLHYFKLSFFQNCFKPFSTLKYPKHYLLFHVHILEKKLKILDSTLSNSPTTSTIWPSFIHL